MTELEGPGSGAMLLGTASSGLQIEGGETNSSWHEWARLGHVADGSHPGRANDHWNRVEEDTALLRELKVQTHRLGIEWARIEPREGRFDGSALAHYRDEIHRLRSAGIVPLVTLHHFANPLWLEHDGAWIAPSIVRRFTRYVRYVVAGLGDLVEDWVTINEPNVYLLQGYVFGAWPPGSVSIAKYFTGLRMMARAHRAAYVVIHALSSEHNRPARVGIAHHLRVFDAQGSGLVRALTVPIARLTALLAQGLFVRTMTRRCSDFLGINYYTRDIVGLRGRSVAKGRPTNDLGWEIYPAGLARVVRPLYRRYRLPVWITENGTADSDDAFREEFIRRHLLVLARLRDQGIPVERYYHWSLTDNFEWAEGELARFGLIRVDYETQSRSFRRSARYFARVCSGEPLTVGSDRTRTRIG